MVLVNSFKVKPRHPLTVYLSKKSLLISPNNNGVCLYFLLWSSVITCQHLSEVVVTELGVRAAVVDVGNGVDKWILMLFPAQPLTHGQTGPLAGREKEPEKDRKNEHK